MVGRDKGDSLLLFVYPKLAYHRLDSPEEDMMRDVDRFAEPPLRYLLQISALSLSSGHNKGCPVDAGLDRRPSAASSSLLQRRQPNSDNISDPFWALSGIVIAPD